MVADRIPHVACICWCLLSLVTYADSPDQEATIRTAVKKSLPFVWAEGQKWIEKHGCVSCHQIPYMVWSLDAARLNGYAVDEKRLAELKLWSTEFSNFDNPKNATERDDKKTAFANIDTMSSLILAHQAETRLETAADWRTTFANYLVEAQQEDGTWKACGQLPFQKRPKAETTEVTTIWTLLALSQTSPSRPLKTEWKDFRNRRLKSGESTEWWAVQLLLALEQGRSDEMAQYRNQLLQLQHEDGGWGWLTNDESDAFGTGIALYALKKAGANEDQSAIRAAENFLLRTQQADGSWKVRSTKAKNQTRITPTATYWGTTWAVIGLVEP